MSNKKGIKTNKKTNKTKILTKIIPIALILVALISTLFFIDSFAVANPKCYHRWVLSTFNGSYNKEGLPETYWEVSPLEEVKDGKRQATTTFAKYYLDYGSGRTAQIWINISDFHNQSTKIEIAQSAGGGFNTYEKETYFFTLTADMVKNSNDGWIKIFDSSWTTDFVIKYTNVWIGFKGAKLRVREVAFLNEEGNLPINTNFYSIGDKTKEPYGGVYGEDGKEITNILPNLKNTTDEKKIMEKRFKKVVKA